MSNSIGGGIYSILADLVGFQTVTGHTEEVDVCFQYILTFLEKHDLQVVHLTSQGFPSIVATTHATKTPKVLLQAHIDVVPAKAQAFTMSETAGKLHGRGVFDMKFAVACYLQLIHELKADLQQYDFGIMLTSDEEIGGENGVKYVLDEGYGAEVCILPDGGNDWHIETTCNAVWIARVTADGRSAHGSRPWEGQNAINSLVEGLGEIQTMFGELKPYKNSITISNIQGGRAVNQVPDEATAVLDMRFTSDQEYARYHTAITNMMAERGLQLETVAQVKARNVNLDQPAVASFLTIAEQVTGSPITKTHSFGATDACYFANHDITTIVIRPTGGKHHSDDEWIAKDELQQFYKVLKTYITEFTKIPA
jgi:succinyl-diaminopimelate desuccinylase